MAVQSQGNEGKTAVMNLKKEHYVLSDVTLGVILHWWFNEAAITKPILFVVHVKYIPFECSLCWGTFLKMKLIKTHLRNQLSQVRLNQLFRNDTQSLKDGYKDNMYE